MYNNINSIPALSRHGDHALNLAALPNVALNQHGLSTTVEDVVDSLLTVVSGAGCNNHFCSGQSKDLGNTLSNALTSTGDDSDPPS